MSAQHGHFLLRWALCVGGLAGPRLVAAQATASIAAPSELVSVYVVLEGEPTVRAHLRVLSGGGGSGPVREAVRRRERELDVQHAQFRGQMRGRGFEETGRFRRLANGFRVRVPAERIPELAGLPGVVRVERARVYYPELDTSLDYAGVPAAWSLAVPGLDGRGIRIGIIDTGIDYTHAVFGGPGTRAAYLENDPTRIDDVAFPTAKVVGGWDFAGDDYRPGKLPRPDPDPLDTLRGHGTFVAGIAAGFGVLPDGRPFAGPYEGPVGGRSFRVAPGVAPGADLYALKVFGASDGTELVPEALEWAADPNGDGDFSDRLDVLNISIGSPFSVDAEGMLENDQVNLLSDLGCIVVYSAGNDGNTYYVGNKPKRALIVGSCIDALSHDVAVEILTPAGSADILGAVEAGFTPPLAGMGAVSAEVVYADPPLACGVLANEAGMAGRIALVDRGDCLFTEKVRVVQDAGAVAAIVANQLDGPAITMSGDADDLVIPAVMISRYDGERLKALLDAGLAVRVISAESATSMGFAGTLSDFSSRGPDAVGNGMGPDLAAPGQDIISADAATGSDPDQGQGTSYSAPHVAGAAALLMQLHPDWSADDVKAALVNSAEPMTDLYGRPYPESIVGAGRLRVDAAARLPVTARTAQPGGDIAVSLGARTFAHAEQGMVDVRIDNHAATTYQLDLGVQETIAQPGFSLGPEMRSITVAPMSTAWARFLWSAEPALFTRAHDAVTPRESRGYACHMLPEASGAILLSHAEFQLRVPYHLVPRAGASYRSVSNLLPLTPGSGPSVVALPMAGASAHPAPLVSVFQLLHRSSDLGIEHPAEAMADLEAVGIACGRADASGVEDAMIYFGIACRRAWTTPIRFLKSVVVEIDSIGGESADFNLYNATEAALEVGDIGDSDQHNNVHLAVLERQSDLSVVTGTYLNVFSPAERDTAVYNSRVMVMAVRAGDLGLSDANSSFRFRVRTYGQFVSDSPRVDATPWLPYDVGLPVMDTCLGLEGTPVYPGGGPVEVAVDTDRLEGLPYPPAVLLLHHMNAEESMVDVVQLGAGAVHYVSPAGSSTPPYTNWTTAAHTIQDALDVAADGHLVLVTNGVHAAAGAMAAGLFTRVAVTNRVTVRSVNGPADTFIEGGGDLGPSAVRCAYLVDGASLVGFTLRNGRTATNAAPATYGGGAYLDHGGTLEDCTVTDCAAVRGGGVYFAGQGTAWNCEIRDNLAEASGGGARMQGGGAIYGSVLAENRAPFGGGLYVSGHGWLISSTVTGNVADTAGGGVDLVDGGWCERSIFSGNASPFGGGARCLRGGVIDDCTFAENAASSGGGGVYLNEGGTVRRGTFTANMSAFGGGARLRVGGLLSGCELRGNTADSNGGGAYVVDGGALEDCGIQANTAAFGGGVLVQNAGEIRDCRIDGNAATSAGGGVYLWGGGELTASLVRANTSSSGGGITLNEGGSVARCTVSGNRADRAGGGIDVKDSGIVRSTLLHDNHASEGGGVRLRYGGELQSCTVVHNTADWGGGLYAVDGGAAENCVLYHNEAFPLTENHFEQGAGMTYAACCTLPAPPGAGNITADPRLAHRAAGNFRPTAESPLMDRGLNRDWMADALDLDGTNRIIAATTDIGAYEYHWTDSDGDTLTDMDEVNVYGTSPFRADSDFDGVPDNLELLAGTDPLDPASRFAVTGIESGGADAITLRWSSASGRIYRISGSPDPQAGYETLQGNIPADPPENSRTLTAPDGGRWLYRISLE